MRETKMWRCAVAQNKDRCEDAHENTLAPTCEHSNMYDVGYHVSSPPAEACIGTRRPPVCDAYTNTVQACLQCL